MERRVKQVFFSPGGTTAKVAHTFTSAICDDVQSLDLLKEKITIDLVFTADDLLVTAMPVFSGRIPSICINPLHRLKGQNTPVVIFAVYGNRAYEDALLELHKMLAENGFVPIAAGAIPARHSIFPKVAQSRPDAKDMEAIGSFAHRCVQKLEQAECAPVIVPGNYPYRDISSIPLTPKGKRSTCTRCGVCAKICPVQAISPEHPVDTNGEKCISCTACIYHCPHNSRAFYGLKYKLAAAAFARKYGAFIPPEFIL